MFCPVPSSGVGSLRLYGARVSARTSTHGLFTSAVCLVGLNRRLLAGGAPDRADRAVRTTGSPANRRAFFLSGQPQWHCCCDRVAGCRACVTVLSIYSCLPLQSPAYITRRRRQYALSHQPGRLSASPGFVIDYRRRRRRRTYYPFLCGPVVGAAG